MRIVSALLAVILLLFAAAQYNDPDPLFWGPIYAIPGLWALAYAIKPSVLRSSAGTVLFAVCFIAALGGLYYFWPQTNEWWMQDVWWEDEAAREGIGMMIVVAVFAYLAAMRFFAAR